VKEEVFIPEQAQLDVGPEAHATREAEFRVWWVPQIPMDPFEFPVPSYAAGLMLAEALGKYDLFQLEHNVKPDYANVGGVQWRHATLTEGEWWDLDEYEAEDLGFSDGVGCGPHVHEGKLRDEP
jgi:hypothetical protein